MKQFSILFVASAISSINFFKLKLTSVLVVAKESPGAAITKKASEGFEDPSGTSFLGGILFTTPDLVSSLALAPGRVPWRLAQEAVTVAGYFVHVNL